MHASGITASSESVSTHRAEHFRKPLAFLCLSFERRRNSRMLPGRFGSQGTAFSSTPIDSYKRKDVDIDPMVFSSTWYLLRRRWWSCESDSLERWVDPALLPYRCCLRCIAEETKLEVLLAFRLYLVGYLKINLAVFTSSSNPIVLFLITEWYWHVIELWH